MLVSNSHTLSGLPAPVHRCTPREKEPWSVVLRDVTAWIFGFAVENGELRANEEARRLSTASMDRAV
jgi:hypothetical protein